METPMSWEQQEVFRLLKAQPGTTYQESDETERHIFRDWMRGLLDVSEVTVTFVKADGTVRDMRCTLDRDRIPPQPPRAEKPAKEAPVDGLRQHGFLGEPKKSPSPKNRTLKRCLTWTQVPGAVSVMIGSKRSQPA